MRFAARLIPALAGLLIATSASAQERVTLSGRVVDQVSKLPVVGASVKLKGGAMVFTNADGRFLLARVPTGAQVLEVRQLGYDELDAELVVGAEARPVELALSTNPVLLEGIEVMVDRLEYRRKGLPTTVSAYGLEDLARSPAITTTDFIRRSTSAQLTQCGGNWCVYKRGRLSQPEVWIDERPAYGGMSELDGYPPQLIHSVEVIGGTHIRVYTQRFAKLLAERKVPLMPTLVGFGIR
jgi:hypothetical protein